jgi:hypothetical protein
LEPAGYALTRYSRRADTNIDPARQLAFYDPSLGKHAPAQVFGSGLRSQFARIAAFGSNRSSLPKSNIPPTLQGHPFFLARKSEKRVRGSAAPKISEVKAE